MIAAGVLKTPEEVVTATASLNREALGKDGERWKALVEGLRQLLNRKAKDKTLVTMDDHAKLWREIAAAMQ